MGKGPSSETDSLSANQKIHQTLWNTNFHQRIHNNPPLVQHLNHRNPIPAPIGLPEDPYKYHIIFYTRVFHILFNSGFPINKIYVLLTSHMRAKLSATIILLDLINRKIFSDLYRSLSFPIYSFPHSPLHSSLSGPNIPLSTTFTNTLSLHYFPQWQQQKASLQLCVASFLYFWEGKFQDERNFTEWEPVLAFSKIEEILRIHVCVDQCVSADWWRRQF